MIIVNLSQNKSNISYYISSSLLYYIENNLKKGKKSILYLNKRGNFASFICEDCGHYYKCKNCDISLTVHHNPERLVCHVCGASGILPKSCVKCNSNKLKKIGVGTKQIEETLVNYFEKKFKNNKSPHPNSLPKGKGVDKNRITFYDQKKYNHRYIVELSKKLRRNGTEFEDILWSILRNRKFNNLKFRRQHAFGRYIVDFYCKEINLAIELDGKIHEKNVEYDKIRDEIIEKHGVKVLRFKNEEIIKTPNKILNSIIKNIPLPLGEFRGGIENNMNNKDIKEKKIPKIFRFDADSTKNKKDKNDAIKKLEQADIIVATKMITTGFDFKNIGLIGVILAEQEFSFAKYNALEKAYSNLTQLIGRGNRTGEKTDIIIQTFIPDNELIKSLTEKNYKNFFIDTLKERKNFKYPPFIEMATLDYRDPSEEKAINFMINLKNKLDIINEKTKETNQSPSPFGRGVRGEGLNTKGEKSEGLNTKGEKIEIILNKNSFKKYNKYHINIILKGNNLRDFLGNIKHEIFRNSNLNVIFE